MPLDWRWVKAMVWTEVLAGPNESKSQWQKLPMQIGVVKGGVTDPGYGVVRDAGQDEGADLVVEDELKQKVQNRANVVGHLNVRTGIAYLFIRYIDGIGADDDKITNSTLQTYTIQSGDKISKLISKGIIKTTQVNIIKNTPGLTKENIGDLEPGQVIKYQEAEARRKITKWKDWMEAIRLYNNKDLEYIPKVKRAYQIITSRTSQ